MGHVYKCDLLDVGWMQGYNGQESVILDDFNPDASDDKLFKTLLQMFDRYPLQMNKKGGSVWFRPTHIFVTSNRAPWDIYSTLNPVHGGRTPGPKWFNECYKLRQLMRRIEYVEKKELPEGIELKYPELKI